MSKIVQVECYSGGKYPERPRSFTLDGERYHVKSVTESFRTPSAIHFRVRTDDDEGFELAYFEGSDEWRIFNPF